MHLKMGLYFVFFVVAYLICHRYAVVLARSLEAGGRLRGRGTVVIFAGPLALLAAMLAVGTALLIGFPEVGTPAATWTGSGVTGLLTVGWAVLLGWLSVVVATHLPRRRRGGPAQRRNAALSALVALAAAWFVPVIVTVLVGAFVVGVSTQPRRTVLDYLLWFALGALGVWMFVKVGRQFARSLRTYAEQLAGAGDATEGSGPTVLYLRPFAEERRLFGPGQTFEEFLSTEVRRRVGPMVALGNPTDRVAPGGAERRYLKDETWKAALEQLARSAECILGVTSSSTSTTWELRRIRELDLHGRLFLLSPPQSPAQAPDRIDDRAPRSRMAKLVRDAGRVLGAYMDNDTTRLSVLLSGGRLPAALSPAGLTPWPDFAGILTACGYAVSIQDPGPGCVIGFDPSGGTVLIGRGASMATDYLTPILDRLP